MPSCAAGTGVTHIMDWLILIRVRAHFMARKIDGSQLGLYSEYTTRLRSKITDRSGGGAGCSVATSKASEDPRVR